MRLAALVAVMLLALARAAWAADPRVHVMEVEGPITPVVATYIERGLTDAAEQGATLVVLRIDTPGGAVDVMTSITRTLQGSSVPVVAWVAPPGGVAAGAGPGGGGGAPRGGMAASAGTFLVLASHVAAMAPGTTIGAASPVGGQGEELPSTMREKTTSVMVSQIKDLARRRGEKARKWAVDSVQNAAAATETDALRLGVIDFVAEDSTLLLAQLQDHEVDVGGESVRLELRGATIVDAPMTAVERFLHTITNPNLVFVLMLLGVAGVIVEMSNPGAILPGVVGGICLLMAFYALGVLPVNYAGVFLIVLAAALFLLELKITSHGLLTVGGIVAMVFGGMILFDSPVYEVSMGVIVVVAICTAAFAAFAVQAALRAQMRRVATGKEALIGRRGTVRAPLDPVGMVMVQGELWSARAEGAPVPVGADVEVVGEEGFELRVRRIGTAQGASPPA